MFGDAFAISSYDNYKDEDDLPLNFHEESDLAVDIILLNMQKILYEYDYGDGWEIEIVVKQIEDIKSYECPKLLQAKGDMVIDDCGGPMGLNEIETSPADINGLNLILEETFGD